MTVAAACRAGAIALVTFVAAVAAGSAAVSTAFRSRSPALVERFASFDALAPVIRVQRELVTNKVDPQILAVTARRALRQQAVSPRALRLLSLAALTQRRSDKALALARLSERTSRRDESTQLLLIEFAVERGDYREALRHYDRALRTDLAIYPILFPVLFGAIADPVIRSALVPLVAQNARWVLSFILEAGGSDVTAPDTAKLLIETGREQVDEKVRAAVSVPLMARLVSLGDATLAYRYLTLIERAPATLTRTGGINQMTTDPRWGPFAWQPRQQGTASGSIETGLSGNTAIKAFINAGERQVVLGRVLSLAPGRYRWHERLRVETVNPGASAGWRMRCIGKESDAVLWRRPTQAPATRTLDAPGPIIPSTCRFQLLELELAGGEGQQELEMTIDQVDLTRFL